MADEIVYESLSQLTAGTTVSATDLVETAEVDPNAGTGYVSKKQTMANVATFMGNRNRISANIADNTDMNTLLTPGIYSKVSGLATLSNNPSTNGCIVEVFQMDTSGYYTMQRWWDMTAAAGQVPCMYTRFYRKSNTTWTGWFVYTPTAV